MNRTIAISLFFLIPSALVWYLIVYGLSHIYDADIAGDGIVFTLFRYKTIGRLEFRNIERAYGRREFLSTHGIAISMFCVIPFVNRIPRGDSPIIVQKRRGIIRYLAITPRHPDAFLRALNEHLRAP